LNWGSTHLRPAANNYIENSQFGDFYIDYATTYEGRVVNVPIIFGENSNPVDSAYGL
jgi:hypothetical protein